MDLTTTGRLLARNTLLNLGTSGVLLGLSLLFVPLMLGAFGAELYGVLTVTWMVLGHLGWLDLGFSRASARLVAREVALGRADRAALWGWTALLTQAALGSAGALVLWGLAPWLVTLLQTQPERRELVILTLRLFAFSLPLDLAARSLTGILQAQQRFGWINALGLFGTLGTYAAYTLGMVRGSDFLTVVYALLALRVLHLAATFWGAVRALPSIGHGSALRSLAGDYGARAREMLRFGGWATLGAVTGPLLLYLDQWVIGMVRGVAALPFYAAPFGLLGRLAVLPASLTTTLYPALTAMEVRAEWQRLEGYFVRAHRYLLLPLIPVLFVLFVWADEIFRLWIGPEFARQAALPFRVLLMGAGVALMAPLSGAVLEAVGRPDLLARLYLAELPLNLVAVLLFTRAYGIVGAAASYTLRALGETAVLWVLLFRVLPLSGRRFLGEGLLPAAIPAGLLGAAAWWIGDARLESPTAWIGTGVALAGYAASIPLFLLDDGDRRFLGQLPGGRGLLGLTVRAFQIARALRRWLDRWGLAELPLLGGVARRVRRRWFEGSYADEEAVVTVRVDGLRLALPGRFLPHFVFQDYEPVTKHAVRELLRPGMTVIDVGAHIGYYTVLAGKLVGETGRVHAVEPAAENLEILRQNIDLNRVRRVTLHPYAAGRERGRRAFHLTGSSDSHGFYPHPLTKTVRTIEVDVVPLDEVVHGPVHLVKVDVEGSEIEVLRGMRRILTENPEVALGIEWNPACMRSAGVDPLELPRVLQELGFGRIDVLDDHGRRIRRLDEVLPRVRTGEVPRSWYVNLWARR